MWRYEPNTFLNADCLPVMREIPDKFFQLAIVDPPYGIGNDGQKKKVCSNPKQSRKEHEQKDWDSKGIPGAEYLTQVLNEEDPEQREKGMAAGAELLRHCKYIFIGSRYGLSEGMLSEIQIALEEGITELAQEKGGLVEVYGGQQA